MNANPGGRNVLITGAAGALGGALAVACAQRGAQVLLLDRDLRGLEATCALVEASGGPGPAYAQLDLALAGPDQVQGLVSDFRGAYGPICSLVHAAARFHALQPLDQVSPEEWLTTLQVNLNACWLLSLACLSDLRSQAGSALVFTLDSQARGRAYWGPYGVSKSALRSLALMFAEELEGTACRVFGVETGPLRSALRATAYHGEHPATVPNAGIAAEFIADLVFGMKEPGRVLCEVPKP